MQQVKIQDLKPSLVSGIDVQMPDAINPYQELYFEWSGSSLMACFNTNLVTGGILKAWHHTPVFQEIETHIDAEMFYFLSGVALMLFVDVKDDQPVLETSQVVRIQPGTQIVISAGKGHFVAVAEGDEPLQMVVVAPRMAAPRILLPLAVQGIT
jgi:mannose-6-phosphate isomerase-like protein (cupin superfamily)